MRTYGLKEMKIIAWPPIPRWMLKTQIIFNARMMIINVISSLWYVIVLLLYINMVFLVLDQVTQRSSLPRSSPHSYQARWARPPLAPRLQHPLSLSPTHFCNYPPIRQNSPFSMYNSSLLSPPLRHRRAASPSPCATQVLEHYFPCHLRKKISTVPIAWEIAPHILTAPRRTWMRHMQYLISVNTLFIWLRHREPSLHPRTHPRRRNHRHRQSQQHKNNQVIAPGKPLLTPMTHFSLVTDARNAATMLMHQSSVPNSLNLNLNIPVASAGKDTQLRPICRGISRRTVASIPYQRRGVASAERRMYQCQPSPCTC